jgi:hypothetical protein
VSWRTAAPGLIRRKACRMEMPTSAGATTVCSAALVPRSAPRVSSSTVPV